MLVETTLVATKPVATTPAETTLVETTLDETILEEITLVEIMLIENKWQKTCPSILVHPVQESANIYPIFVDDILRFGRHHWKH